MNFRRRRFHNGRGKSYRCSNGTSLMDLKVFTGSSNRPLAQGICEVLGQESGAMEYVRFSNENIKGAPYGCLTARTNRESQSLAASSPTSSQKQGLIASLR